MKNTVDGKDQAIDSLSQTVMSGAKENERLAEMLSTLKNKMMNEMIFDKQLHATIKTSGVSSLGISLNSDVTFSFVREVDTEEEYFLKIIEKGKDEPVKIPVNDIDGMEHCEGSLKFFLHYQSKKPKSQLKQFQNLVKSNLMGKKSKDKYETYTEVFESKFVKHIIECFNGVLTIMEDEEHVLNEFIDYEQEPIKIQPKKSIFGSKKAKEPKIVENYVAKKEEKKVVEERKSNKGDQSDRSSQLEYYDEEYDDEDCEEEAK